MTKKILLLVLLLALPPLVWLWWEWDRIAIGASASAWSPAGGAASAEPAAERDDCRNRYPGGRAWFGDLHLHTAYSMDARSRNMLGTPDDAYRFARGEAIGLGPFDDQGKGMRTAQLQRPLDFAAVTDHAEWVGEVAQCSLPGSKAYDTPHCSAFRGERDNPLSISTLIAGDLRLLNVVGFGDRKAEICGPDNRWCRDSLKAAWGIMQDAAEAHYDRSSDCSFTTFHGYEYSASPGRSKVHRNVIFRNERVPELPVSSLEESDVLGLWESVDTLCNQAEGDCEALAIPHNSNVSNGRMFSISWRDEAPDEQRRQAALRARMEPLVEITQIKGDSECKPGMWQVFGEDELCDFEKLRGLGENAPEDCRDDYGTGAIMGVGCQSRLDFARYALAEGMAEASRIGINPYRFGFIGSTDSHNASPGDVEEDSYDGCCADEDTTIASRLDPKPDFAGKSVAMRNPGGLVGLWAPENTRDALFDAMQRREAFATSGPRIEPRLFVGRGIAEDICDGEFVAEGYRTGVPMGGVIDAQLPESPVFAAAASADPQGGLLQRLQLIKIWHDADGGMHQSVIDVAGDGNNGATVDLDNCAVSGPGERQFCATWRDPAFDPGQPAAYYVRVVENPSCRWSWRQCLSLPEGERPVTCGDPSIPKVIQERAWTSPVWYDPAG